ncbi:MAG: hypothetical protein RLZZ499_2404, partial [Cyanobacteriota bacterium]
PLIFDSLIEMELSAIAPMSDRNLKLK